MIARDRSPWFAGLMCLCAAGWIALPLQDAVGWPKDAVDWFFQIARIVVAANVCISIWRDRA